MMAKLIGVAQIYGFPGLVVLALMAFIYYTQRETRKERKEVHESFAGVLKDLDESHAGERTEWCGRCDTREKLSMEVTNRNTDAIAGLKAILEDRGRRG